jgi:aspartyl-tRNA(Asn)/glutamyl-tRNA(Gln) amidotransferase subunit A
VTALPRLTLTDASELVRTGQLSPVELMNDCLARLAATEPTVGAYAAVDPEQALEQARQAEQQVQAGDWRGPLHGVPVAVKDLIDVQGFATRAGAEWDPPPATRSAPAVLALQQAGAIVVGKTHTHPWGAGVHTPATRNPWDPTRIPGGSSGGSAAAVAAGSCLAALGTDSGGSVRIPAALCGVTGLKTTNRKVSTDGVVPLAWTLDSVGPIARTAADCTALFAALAGAPPPAEIALGALTIGIPDGFYTERIDRAVAGAVEQAVAVLSSAGTGTQPVTLSTAPLLMPLNIAITLAEAAATHYERLREQPGLFAADVVPLLAAGQLITAVDYLHAQQARHVLQQEWHDVMRDVDVVITATVPTTAALADATSTSWADGDEPILDTYLRFTAGANLLGLPALTLPAGFDAQDLPIGVQLIGRPGEEHLLLALGRAYQQTTDWHRRTPPTAAGP